MKDNFSGHAKQYAQFRPHYPPALFDWLFSLTGKRNIAWDCGTGNGQVAEVLAEHFKNVFATDISEQQLEEAVKKENIHYSIQPAEKTSFHDNFFDMVTVAQAIHWFRFDEFYKEVKRVSKPGAIIAAIGYGLMETAEPLQQLIHHFYYKVVGPYWDAERRYIDDKLRTIPFPFAEIKTPRFEMAYKWNFEQLIGYINTWSAVKHYAKRHTVNPVDALEKDLKYVWGNDLVKPFSFPLLLRVGNI